MKQCSQNLKNMPPVIKNAKALETSLKEEGFILVANGLIII